MREMRRQDRKIEYKEAYQILKDVVKNTLGR